MIPFVVGSSGKYWAKWDSRQKVRGKGGFLKLFFRRGIR